MGSGFWSLAIVAGPLIFIAVAIFVAMRNRLTPREEAKSERATKRLYDELDAEDHGAESAEPDER